MVSQCILKAGVLSQKRKALTALKRFVVLCVPSSIVDIQDVYTAIFKTDPAKEIDMKTVPWLGNVACAAVRGTPLLVIMPNENSVSNPVFIHFSDVRAISDEEDLRSACNFAIHTDVKGQDHRFVASSSIEYQEWSQALKKAMSMIGSEVDDLEDEALLNLNMNALMDFERMASKDAKPLPRPIERQYSNSSMGLPPAAEHEQSFEPHAPQSRFEPQRYDSFQRSAPSPITIPSQNRRPTNVRSHVLPDDVAPQHSTSRKFVLGQDMPRSPGAGSPRPYYAAESERPSSQSTIKSSATQTSQNSNSRDSNPPAAPSPVSPVSAGFRGSVEVEENHA
ncbi:hypothetical protein DFS34DRAFT_148448 [Phlyctochytrium arcticum]|nr:hypothetical protein DFS34DRAFT_148448 [Phlyctochytrium arcticum]